MVTYVVSYDNGHKQKITATAVEYDIDSEQYIFTDTRGGVVALAPRGNVLSVLRQDDEAVTG